jgi:ribonuclease BN (tRNA processing enzyme)
LPLSPTKPDFDELEITLIGPGQGECCLLHLGNARWIVVDSCKDNRTNVPAALGYLSSIGTTTDSVELIVATHWHDDHISGLAETLKVCRKAKFCTSSALSSNEFLANVAPYNNRLLFAGGSGVAEIFEVIEELRVSGRTPALKAGPDRRLVQIAADQFAHNFDCEIWSLSPSDAQIQAFHVEIAALIPQIRDTKRRLPSQRQNSMSVVTFIQVGAFAALLGGDLETTTNTTLTESVLR